MTGKEINEVLIGVGIIGIAAYFLWPKHPVPIDIGNPANDPVLEHLGGLAMPGLPGYLSSNRPGYAIAPEPFRQSLLPGLNLSNPTYASVTSPAFLEWPSAVENGQIANLPGPPAVAEPLNHGCCC